MEIRRRSLEMTFKQKLWRYWINWWIGIDQWINTWFAGDPDETMSSRMGKWLSLPHDTWKWKIAYVLCRMLHWLDKNHCIDSIEEDEGKYDLLRKNK